jgi:uncharacterized protein (TIGR03435 family)
MVDLVRTAYSVDAEKVVGGPNWLEFDRFDITALVPPDASQDTLKLMLQSLLADRFKLAVHKDTKPLAGLVLSAGKGKPRLKEADPSSGKTGCQPHTVPPPAPTPGQITVPMMALSCHNITMEAFASQLKGPAGGGYTTNDVVDSTGLKGSWDFEIKFANRTAFQITGSGVTLAEAIDKQLGLKLEEQQLPTAVIVVDGVNQKPSDNSPDTAKKLPHLPPTEFEVAD